MTLIDANRAHVDALNKNGAHVIGKMELSHVPVKAITPDEMDGIYDLAILLAKQTYNDVALRQLLPHMSPPFFATRAPIMVPREPAPINAALMMNDLLDNPAAACKPRQPLLRY